MGFALGPVGLVVAAVGAATSVYSAVSQASAARAQAKTARQYAEYNRQVASQNATAQAERARLAAKRQIGSQRAAFAASGLETDSGSPLLVTLDQALEGEMAAQQTIRQGIIQGVGYQSEIDQANLRARSATTEAYATGIGGVVGAASNYFSTKAALQPRNTTLISGQDLIG